MSSENSAIPVCPEQQILRTSQGNLSFRACGEGETLIFLHGILGSSKAWPFQFAAFSPRYRVMAWDAPGYADSALVPAEIDAFVLMLHEWVQHCGAEKVFLVGHSMGGTVASRYAARYPERVKIWCCPAPIPAMARQSRHQAQKSWKSGYKSSPKLAVKPTAETAHKICCRSRMCPLQCWTMRQKLRQAPIWKA